MSIIYLINSQCENDNKTMVAQLARVQNLSVQLNIFIWTDFIIIFSKYNALSVRIQIMIVRETLIA